MTSVPDLSVLIATYNARSTVKACLDSLRNQRTEHCFETILVDSGTDGTSEFVTTEYPEVKLIHSARRLYCGDARNCGIVKARAPLIAFLDADCTVLEDWVQQICDAHRQSILAVAGSVHNGSSTLVSWAYYFCEFNLWTPARNSRQIREAPGCALSIKRAAFDRFGPFPGGSYCSDTVFHWRMQSAGEPVLFCPSIAVFHTYEEGWKQLVHHIVEHRRHFALVESRHGRMGLGRRLIAIAVQPIEPFLLALAVAWRLRHTPGLYVRYVQAAVPTFLGFCARAWGQTLGYLHPRLSHPA